MKGSRNSRLVTLGWLSRGFGMIASLAAIRITLRILGESQFAVFQILVAALAWMGLSSFGLGPALKNLVSEYRARGETDLSLRTAAAALVALLLVVGVLLLALGAPFATMGLLHRLSHDELWAYRAFLVGGILSLITALGQVGMEVLYAEFRAAWVYWLSILSSTLTLLALLRIGGWTAPVGVLLFSAICATIGPQALAGVAALWMTRLLGPPWRTPSAWMVRRIAGLALRFWGFALLSNLVLLIDTLVISQILGARDIVLYSIMMKVTTVGLVLFTTVIAVNWPEWTHHWELRQFDVLSHRVRTLALAGVVLCVPAALLAVYLLPPVIRLWLHDATLAPPALLIVTFIGYLAVRLWTDVHSSALMAGNRIGSATRFALTQAVITGPLEYVFGRQWGAEGVVLGLLVGFLSTTAWLFPWRLYRELRSLSAADRLAAAGGGQA